MKKIIIELCFNDEEYGRALTRALSFYYKSYILHLTKSEIKDKTPGDFISVSFSEDGGTAYFTDCCGIAADRINKKNNIYKYQSIHSIMHEFFSMYKIKFGYGELLADNVFCEKIFPVIGMTGGAGASSISYTISRHIALYFKKKILYISLGLYNGLSGTLGASHREAVRRYVYDMETKNQDDIEHLKYVYLDENGIYGLRYEDNINYLKWLDSTDILHMINKICDALSIDYIVIDCGADISAAQIEILSELNTLLLVHKEKIHRQHREALLNYLECEAKVINIINMYNDDLNFDSTCDDFFAVDYDPSSFLGEKIDMDRDFGIHVLKICEALLGI